jgi:hypothetical protein
MHGCFEVYSNIENDYLRMAESTAQATMYKFYRAILGMFRPVYLRALNVHDTTRIFGQKTSRGFSRMLRSIDYTHWDGRVASLIEGECTRGHTTRAA